MEVGGDGDFRIDQKEFGGIQKDLAGGGGFQIRRRFRQGVSAARRAGIGFDAEGSVFLIDIYRLHRLQPCHIPRRVGTAGEEQFLLSQGVAKINACYPGICVLALFGKVLSHILLG